ncbi:transcription regulator protein BACH1b [Aulostomus maculatus]
MSLEAMSAPRLSMFTFESTAHSSHVLRSLDEQRRRDMLCDVTVVVEGQSFRAHRSVLASCSEYFTRRFSSPTQHGEVITLPEEVTSAGFEPLLMFAYTSKLLFGKDNALEIRNSASILGFRDLEDSCFDFLLLKFIPDIKSPAPSPVRTCCKKICKRRPSKEDGGEYSESRLLENKEVKAVADSSSQQEVALSCNKTVKGKVGSQKSSDTLSPVDEEINGHFIQRPKYRKFQQACGKETCVTEKSLNNPISVIKGDPSGSNCCKRTNSGSNTEVEFPGKSEGVTIESWKTETHDMETEEHKGRGGVTIEIDTRGRDGKWKQKEMDVLKMEEEMEHTSVRACRSVPGERSPGLIMHHCPLKAFGESPAIIGSLVQESFVMDTAEDKKTRDSGLPEPESLDRLIKPEEQTTDDGMEEKGHERQMCKKDGNDDSKKGTIKKEVAEHLVKWLGSDMSSSQLDLQDSDAASSSDSRQLQSTSSEWLQLNLSTRCPFLLQDLDQSKFSWKGKMSSEFEGASQSSVSSLNSGEDGDSETEGESESYTRERARQVQLPFDVDWIVNLSRNEFQQLLKQQVFTREQLEFVYDMRRRSKNRLAAQRCRKRKLDCIYNLQCEINKLKTEREKLIMEKSQLNQMKVKTSHSVSALCRRVCSEANLQPEQLQVLAKYTSSECPLSSLLPHIDSLITQPGASLHPQASFSTCPVSLDVYTELEEASSSTSRDAAN